MKNMIVKRMGVYGIFFCFDKTFQNLIIMILAGLITLLYRDNTRIHVDETIKDWYMTAPFYFLLMIPSLSFRHTVCILLWTLLLSLIGLIEDTTCCRFIMCLTFLICLFLFRPTSIYSYLSGFLWISIPFFLSLHPFISSTVTTLLHLVFRSAI